MKQEHDSIKRTHRLVLLSLFASLTVVTTLLFRFPIPFAQGYLNGGDGIVMLAALVLGPSAGFWVGSIGSMLADLIAGYAMYMPFTFIIKGIEGLIVGWLFLKFKKAHVPVFLAGAWMAVGYILADWILYSLAAAIAAFPMNLLQGAVGAVIALLLFKVIQPIFASKFHL